MNLAYNLNRIADICDRIYLTTKARTAALERPSEADQEAVPRVASAGTKKRSNVESEV